MNRKRITLLVLCILLMAGSVISSFAEGTVSSFTDVGKSDWFFELVSTAARRGIVNGYPDGSFKPSEKVSYGEFLAMSMNLEKLTKPNNPGHWAEPYYRSAISRGIISETDFSVKDLDKTIPRKHMALILAGLIKARDTVNQMEPACFSDISDNPYADAIELCGSSGVLSGYPDGSFRPEGGLTRSEASAAVMNYISLLDKELISGGEVVQIYENGNLMIVNDDGSYEMYYGHNTYMEIDPPDPGEDADADSLMRSDHKALLDQVLASATISGTPGNYSFTYTQPKIEDRYHFAVDLHIYKDNSQGGSDVVFFSNSDAGWIMHRENYDPSPKTVSMKLDGISKITDTSVILKLQIFDLLDESTLEFGEGATYVYSFDVSGTYMLVSTASRFHNGEVKDYKTIHKDKPCPAFKW